LISQSTLIIIVYFLIVPIAYPNFTFARNFETIDIPYNMSNLTITNEDSVDNSKLLTSTYTPDQINEIIYNLYQQIQNSNHTEIRSGHDIAVLIDLICSDEYVENAVEACDIVAELPLD
jgi:hypothetical protein